MTDLDVTSQPDQPHKSLADRVATFCDVSKGDLPALAGGTAIALAIFAGIFSYSWREASIATTADVGRVQEIAPAEAYFRDDGIYGGVQTDRAWVMTDRGRYMVTGISPFDQGADLEIRVSGVGKRTLCMKHSRSCVDLWGDRTPTTTTKSGAAQ